MLNAIDSKLFGHLDHEKKYCSVYNCDKFKRLVPDWKPMFDLYTGMQLIYKWWESEGFPFDVAKNNLEDLLCFKIKEYTNELANIYLNP